MISRRPTCSPSAPPLLLALSGMFCLNATVATIARADIKRATPAASAVRVPSAAAPVMTALSTELASDVLNPGGLQVLQQRAHAPRSAPVYGVRLTAPRTQVRATPKLRTLLAAAGAAPAPDPAPATPATPTTADPAPSTVAPVAAPAPAPVVVAPVPAPVARDANGVPLVTNVFIESDLRQALSDIAAQTGVPIIADATVQGTVSADLNNVPLERALEMLLQSGGYALINMEGYYLAGMADPANPNFYLYSRTEVVELNHVSPRVVLDLLSIPYGRYLSAENFAPTITEVTTNNNLYNQQNRNRRSIIGLGGLGNNSSVQNLGVSSPSVNLPPEGDKVSITAPPNLIARIRADIENLDRPRTQVMLEAVVLEITEEALKEVGLDFTSRFLSGSLLSGVSNLTYSAIGNDEAVRLTALVRNGTARLRANPRVSTAEGQTAEIEVGRENYFEIDTGNNNLSYATLEVIKSGILLRITPKVLEATGEVMARIEPEVRDVTGRSSNGLPEITFRRAATNMRVRDGQSIVIGGLINEFTNVTRSKVPVLGDIPIIGNLFRGTNSNKNKTEVVIVITPRILTDNEISDRVRNPILQNDLETYREGGSWEPFAFPKKND